MRKIKILQTVVLAVLALAVSTHAWSTKKTEPNVIDKKDVVDEVNRSEIEKNESSEAPKIDNIIPVFEMPSFKTNTEKNTKKSTVVKQVKSKPKVEKKQDKVTEKTEVNVVEKKPPVQQIDEVKKVTQKPEEPKKRKKKQRKKPTVFIKKPLKASQLLVNDTISLVKDRLLILRSKEKYVYKYRFKSSIPLDSKGLEKIGDNRYLVVDKQLLISDIEEYDKTSKTEEIQEIPDEILSKRKVLEKKYNRGRRISLVIPAAELNKNDMIYVFGKVQMVTRNYTGRVSTKKYWLFPTIDVNNPALLKSGKGKYKVIKKVQ